VVRMYHVPVLRHFAREGALAVNACLDVNPEAAAWVAKILGAPRHGGLVEGPSRQAGAVLVATPPDSHAEIARRFLRAGKHVFLEKPFVVAADDAHELVRLAKQVNRRLLVGHLRRFYPSLRVARRYLAAGGLGRLQRVEATEGARWEWPALSRYFLSDRHGGVAWDTGAHLLDMVLYALSLDAPDRALHWRIRTVSKSPPQEPAHELHASLDVEADGMPRFDVLLKTSRLHSLAGALKFFGERGVLVVSTSFSSTARVETGGEPFRLASTDLQAAPLDSLGCFLLEHAEALEAFDGERPSALDAENFITLTSILAGLSSFEAMS
jgi:predicted dehydrogenase